MFPALFRHENCVPETPKAPRRGRRLHTPDSKETAGCPAAMLSCRHDGLRSARGGQRGRADSAADDRRPARQPQHRRLPRRCRWITSSTPAPRSSATRRRSTSIRRSRTPCATGWCTAGWRRSGRTSRGREARLLPVVGVPHRPQPGPVPDEHGPARGGGGAGGRPRLRPGRDSGARGRSRPGQRRPGPAGGVFHGLAGDAGAARDRLRHPLRLRHVRAAHRRRPPGRAARQLAAARQRLGAAAPRGRADRSTSAAASMFQHDRDGRLRADWVDTRDVIGAALRFVHRRPPHRHGEHAAAVGGARHARLRPAVLQRGRLPARRRGEDRHREHLQGPLPERPERRGQGAAAQAAVLLRRLLDRGHRAPVQEAAQRLRRCFPTSSRSSSTTPTRRSRSPS